ncbi:hypothetical protein G6703_02175 [Polynucleobacter paneuropaeus]|nr:hypothetical protein G6703_02175 [Polynucleobacter paneuropaeus]
MTKNRDEEIEEWVKRLNKEYEENEDEDEELIRFKIITTEPNRILEIEKWEKGQHQLHIKMTYESGYVIVDLEPYLDDSYTEEVGIDVNNSDFWIDEENFEHPTYSYEFLTDTPKPQQEEIILIYESKSEDGLKEDGWDLKEKEIWFKGKLKIEELEW